MLKGLGLKLHFTRAAAECQAHVVHSISPESIALTVEGFRECSARISPCLSPGGKDAFLDQLFAGSRSRVEGGTRSDPYKAQDHLSNLTARVSKEFTKAHRLSGPKRATGFDLVTSVDVTLIFPVPGNAISNEPSVPLSR